MLYDTQEALRTCCAARAKGYHKLFLCEELAEKLKSGGEPYPAKIISTKQFRPGNGMKK